MTNKVTVITATFNAGKTLVHLINSIINQSDTNYELILIDGGSKDNTVDIIKQYSSYIFYWISEPDNGIYDAWNKGIQKASGNWIMFLGADDTLNPDALKQYRAFISNRQDKDLQYISSRVEMVDLQGRSIRIKGWPWQWPRFLKDMTVAHTGSLHAKSLFGKYGLFDTSYKITGDYELLLRPRDKLKAAFMNEVTVRMSEGGASDSAAALKEHQRAAVTTGGASEFMMMLNKWYIFSKITIKGLLRKMGFNVYLKN